MLMVISAKREKKSNNWIKDKQKRGREEKIAVNIET